MGFIACFRAVTQAPAQLMELVTEWGILQGKN